MTSPPLLVVEGVTVRFGGLVANNDVSIACPSGAITALLGPNGAGKSTLFDVISGARRPDAGRVVFDGWDVTGMSIQRRARLGMSRTFQNLLLAPDMSVAENVRLGAGRFLSYGVVRAALRSPKARSNDRFLARVAAAAIEACGLGPVQHQLVGSLPVGDLHRIEIARALALGPSLLLADEPAAGLNTAEVEEMGEAFLRIREALGVTILLVEHDLALVRQVAEFGAVLDFGVLLAAGTIDAVMNDERVVEAYVGAKAR